MASGLLAPGAAVTAGGVGRVSRLAVGLALFGGTALAFRWPSPVGNISISRLGAALVVALLGLSILGGQSVRVPAGLAAVVATGLGLLLMNLVGLFYSLAFHIGVFQIGNLLEVFVLFVGVFLLLSKNLVGAGRHELRRAAALPLWGFLPAGLLGMFQALQLYRGQAPTISFVALSGADPAYGATRTAFNSGLNDLGLDRVAGATGDPPTFGILCGMVLIYTLWLHRIDLAPGRSTRYVFLAVAGLGVVFSASASAVLVTTLGVLVILVPRGDRVRLLVRGSAAIGVFALVASRIRFVELFYASARLRIDPLLSGGGTANEHLSLLRTAWDIFLGHPAVGAGAGSLGTIQNGYDVGYSSVHNAYLLVLAEGGVLGFLVLAAFLYAVGRLAPLAVVVGAGVAFFVYLDLNRLPYIWALLAVAAAVRWSLDRSAGLDGADRAAP